MPAAQGVNSRCGSFESAPGADRSQDQDVEAQDRHLAIAAANLADDLLRQPPADRPAGRCHAAAPGPRSCIEAHNDLAIWIDRFSAVGGQLPQPMRLRSPPGKDRVDGQNAGHRRQAIGFPGEAEVRPAHADPCFEPDLSVTGDGHRGIEGQRQRAAADRQRAGHGATPGPRAGCRPR